MYVYRIAFSKYFLWKIYASYKIKVFGKLIIRYVINTRHEHELELWKIAFLLRCSKFDYIGFIRIVFLVSKTFTIFFSIWKKVSKKWLYNFCRLIQKHPIRLCELAFVFHPQLHGMPPLMCFFFVISPHHCITVHKIHLFFKFHFFSAKSLEVKWLRHTDKMIL